MKRRPNRYIYTDADAQIIHRLQNILDSNVVLNEEDKFTLECTIISLSMRMLKKHEVMILELLYKKIGSPIPSFSEIAYITLISLSYVGNAIIALTKKGYLSRKLDTTRSVVITDKGKKFIDNKKKAMMLYKEEDEESTIESI